MPNKPARYGIKVWVACDARSSYAWKMQLYMGKKPAAGRGGEEGGEKGKGRGGSEKNQATRVVLDVTEGLTGRNITCDNFFTSYELAQRLLLERNDTLLGTIRKNKPELPDALLALRGRRVLSSKFAFTCDTTLVSYLAKKNKNVLLLSTFHARTADVVGPRRWWRADKKPAIVLEYNSNKGGVDNLDKVVATYSCRRITARWPPPPGARPRSVGRFEPAREDTGCARNGKGRQEGCVCGGCTLLRCPACADSSGCSSSKPWVGLTRRKRMPGVYGTGRATGGICTYISTYLWFSRNNKQSARSKHACLERALVQRR
ncbi:piggyBac transposable element-derived protein 4-like isoform X1 [Thunnus albacares]|uniref:piggyBac transposable element-derived protein 4-like isoform X1 n=1 Tax=Thunnus albacares TaxID=8236 RepID=UPI001CF6475F|nr:piggyBac transposable element-derived protein 4-like isoform X1 [Thunnus albacares]